MKTYVILRVKHHYYDYDETDKSIWFTSTKKEECLNAIDYYLKDYKPKRDERPSFEWELYECDQYKAVKIATNFEE